MNGAGWEMKYVHWEGGLGHNYAILSMGIIAGTRLFWHRAKMALSIHNALFLNGLRENYAVSAWTAESGLETRTPFDNQLIFGLTFQNYANILPDRFILQFVARCLLYLNLTKTVLLIFP